MEFPLPQSKEERDEMVERLIEDQELFERLMEAWTKQELPPRIGWVLTFVLERKGMESSSWSEPLIDLLKVCGSDEDKRNVCRSLQFLEIPDERAGELIDLCYKILWSGTEKPAARVFAMTIISNQVRKYPELLPEFEQSIAELKPMGSAGFHSRARRLLKELRKKRGHPGAASKNDRST